MVSNRYLRFGDVGHQHPFGMKHVGAVLGKSDAIGNAEHMSVNSEGGLIKDDRRNYIGSLAADARKSLQLVYIGRHHIGKIRVEHARHCGEMSTLAVGVGYRLDIGEDVVRRGLGHGSGIRVGSEEGGRNEVDPLISALGRKDDRHEKFEGIAIAKFGSRFGPLLLEISNHALVALFLLHLFIFFPFKNRHQGVMVGNSGVDAVIGQRTQLWTVPDIVDAEGGEITVIGGTYATPFLNKGVF